MKKTHEIRDPIHDFIKVTAEEREIIDSSPFQRLRYIHQLALTYLLYPGASHKRFEHSLGVLELASKIYDILTNPENIHSGVKKVMPEITDSKKIKYWRGVLRAAALCHDLGHIPFSHAAEKELLPEGMTHESFTLELISELEPIWERITPPMRTEDIKKIAVGVEEYSGESFTNWESILSEIITGDSFGADRMDYLLRDSHHIGVSYGTFDHFRL
ncbi:MAG: HD domain-containing protein, partial [Halanaerobiales bacterium]